MRLVGHFLLRRAGFPFCLLDELSAVQCNALAETIVHAEAETAPLRHHLLSDVFPAEVATSAKQGNHDRLRLLSRLRHCVGHNIEPKEDDIAACLSSTTLGSPLTAWLSYRQQYMEARTDLSRRIESEYLTLRARLRALLARQDILEALFLLSPDFFNAAIRWQTGSPPQEVSSTKERAFEQRLFLYLQRLASKNETTSFFGPLTYGIVDQSATQWTFASETASGVVQREVFATFWAVAALGRAACRDDTLHRALPLRRLGVASIQEHTLSTGMGKSFRVDADTARVFRAANGLLTVDELASSLTIPIEKCEKVVSRLEQLGLLRCDLEPASTEAQSLAEVRSRLPHNEAGEHWRHVFDEFNGKLQHFAEASLSERQLLLVSIEEQFQAITGESPRRQGGHMYADRQVFYEDCLGDMQPVRCPGSEAERIEQELAPVLRLGMAYGELRYQAVRTLATRILEKIGSPVPFLTFAETIDHPSYYEELQALLEPAQAFIDSLRKRVLAVSHGSVAQLDAHDIDDLIAGIASSARAVSLDLMLAQRDGAIPQIVLGEAHPYVFAWGSQGYFAPHKAAMLEAFASNLDPWGGQARMATVLRRRKHKGLLSSDFPGRFIEISGMAGVQPARRIAVADMLVTAGKTGPVLCAPDGQELLLYVGENDHLHLRCFAPAQVEMPLISCGANTPRIQIGDVVYQRQRWELAENTLPTLNTSATATDLAIEVARQRLHWGWPRYLFAKSASEPKPVCLDLNVPFAQIVLHKFLQGSALTLVEMFPGPQTLWLQRHAGSFTSELRVQFVL